MTIIPAIDLKDGRCVRLRQGRTSDETVYSADPVGMAQAWEQQGAAWLHVVDLDGALQGLPVHTAVIEQIVRAVRIPVEVGGGLRTDEQVAALLAVGAQRAVLGTRACLTPETLARLVQRFGERLAVGLDARGGQIAIKGWTETTEMDALALAARLEAIGIQTLIYTDIVQDGMLTGPNVMAIAALCERVACRVIASGGVAAPVHVAALAALGKSNLAGVIVGKALYDGVATFHELRNAAGGTRP
ncbi:MAG: 1-(5-phosphoribosyl)-5-[(5-phosphoribosylamino)methylideneamino]imidazole-4-carboxamide isomerase [Lentisphaerae bacterium]|nr:1-(5-phosphoribosyl)-5-[(5-phosphoribosylamino)methylideneamino]imidazole-4-carboxamide isomerase [Lentisphaerota bacterium]